MKKCLVIYNPNAGIKKNDSFLKEYEQILKSYGYNAQIITSMFQGHIEKLINQSSENYDLVITIGGDGTFNEAVNGNLTRRKRYVLAHIPTGTTNDIGKMYGYDKNIINNLKQLLEGKVKKVDICKINNRSFVYVAGFGKFTRASYVPSRRIKKIIGYSAYLIEGIKELFSPTKLYEITYECDGKKKTTYASFLLVSNANRIAGINQFYDDVKLDDDRFEVLICNLRKFKDVVKSLYYVAKKDITKAPGFIFIKTNKLLIKMPNKKIAWTVDGEKFKSDVYSFEFSLDHNFKIMIPQKNIKNLFNK